MIRGLVIKFENRFFIRVWVPFHISIFASWILRQIYFPQRLLAPLRCSLLIFYQNLHNYLTWFDNVIKGIEPKFPLVTIHSEQSVLSVSQWHKKWPPKFFRAHLLNTFLLGWRWHHKILDVSEGNLFWYLPIRQKFLDIFRDDQHTNWEIYLKEPPWVDLFLKQFVLLNFFL